MNQYICIDIGGTAIKHGIIDAKSNIVTKAEISTEAYKGGKHILNQTKSIIKSYITSNRITGICISTAGVVDHKYGKIISACELIPNYAGTEFKKEIELEFNIRCEVENDVNCAALGELYNGSARNTSSCVCLTVGTGIGGCIIIDKKIWHGYNNFAGEIGHILINNVPFQDIASTSKVVEKIANRKNIAKENLNGKIIFELANKGDSICIEEIDNMINILGIGISNIIYMINPEIVILGGGIMAEQNYIFPKLKDILKSKLIPMVFENTKIKFAENKNSAGMIGAMYNFININKR